MPRMAQQVTGSEFRPLSKFHRKRLLMRTRILHFGAGGKESFSWDSVKSFNKTDLAGTSLKKTGPFLLAVLVPGCGTHFPSGWHRTLQAVHSWALAWFPLLGRVDSSTAGKLEARSAIAGGLDVTVPSG